MTNEETPKEPEVEKTEVALAETSEATTAEVPVTAAATATDASSEDEDKSSNIRSSSYKPFGGPPSGGRDDSNNEKVVAINRCAKVVKGGRRFSFSALVVTGDQAGNVGYGFGKANEVSECIRKASEAAKKSMVPVSLKGPTIPHEVLGVYGGGKVLLRPASPGTGIIAGGGVRAVVEAAGVKDVLAKSLGSSNPFNVVKATLNALTQLRTREQIYKLRGKKTVDQTAL